MKSLGPGLINIGPILGDGGTLLPPKLKLVKKLVSVKISKISIGMVNHRIGIGEVKSSKIG